MLNLSSDPLPLQEVEDQIPNISEAQPPRFAEGDRLRWCETESDADFGVVIGRFYNYAPHSRQWQWCYILWLDVNSESASWCQIDTAWEEDLDRLPK
ncbi:hypothetical protein [[Phormidium ambiguum] IAM M-71]|uniref:hypothetical protein n=1 Tax=[Phormidium ambiguum] IAM M-71 TaxID=454136 RepID=UPI001C49EE15|nr:hypothetical protein [Phormidium ambiguum]